jgi:uncharacterized membrane protein
MAKLGGGTLMTWKYLKQLRRYIQSSLWVVPFVAIPLELVATRLLHRLDVWLGWSFLGVAVPGAQATFQVIVTATLSFIVFTFGSLLVAIQIASAQLTPRVIATTLLRDNVVKYTVGLFIFSLLFALSAQNRMTDEVHELVFFTAAFLGVSCFAAFFYLSDYASRLLRPISILTKVGNDGLAVIKSVYPDVSFGSNKPEGRHPALGSPGRVIQHEGRSEIILAVDLKMLVEEAERANGVIEFLLQVGDFVALDEPLFNLYGGAAKLDDRRLRATVLCGPERTMEQDPAFAFRIVIDIALKALSPAINDPTTAVLAIDQLYRMLRTVGKRHLRADEILDASGQFRVFFRTPNWEDFVHLAFTEIRACGSSNMQIARRLRAMIENLIQTLPAHRHLALRQELDLLDRETARHFVYPEELQLARIADSQGLGGHSGKPKT